MAPAAGGAGVWTVAGERLQLLRTPARPAGSGQVAAAAFGGDGRIARGGRGRRRFGLGSERRGSDSWSGIRPATHRSFAARRRTPCARPERLAHCHRRKGVADGVRRTRALARRDRRAQPGRTSGSRAAPGTATIVRVGSGAAVATLGRARWDPRRRPIGDLQPGRQTVSSRGATPLRLWDAATGKQLGPWARRRCCRRLLVISRDGRLVLVTFSGERAAHSAPQTAHPSRRWPGRASRRSRPTAPSPLP